MEESLQDKTPPPRKGSGGQNNNNFNKNMKKMFSKDWREAVYGALVVVVTLMCAGCSQGRLHEVSDGETRGRGGSQEGQTGVTVHVDTAWQDTIRVQI